MSDKEILKRLETIEAQNDMILLYIQKKIELSPELKEIFNSMRFVQKSIDGCGNCQCGKGDQCEK